VRIPRPSGVAKSVSFLCIAALPNKSDMTDQVDCQSLLFDNLDCQR
jgi:hypothetical protein